MSPGPVVLWPDQLYTSAVAAGAGAGLAGVVGAGLAGAGLAGAGLAGAGAAGAVGAAGAQAASTKDATRTRIILMLTNVTLLFFNFDFDLLNFISRLGIFRPYIL